VRSPAGPAGGGVTALFLAQLLDVRQVEPIVPALTQTLRNGVQVTACGREAAGRDFQRKSALLENNWRSRLMFGPNSLLLPGNSRFRGDLGRRFRQAVRRERPRRAGRPARAIETTDQCQLRRRPSEPADCRQPEAHVALCARWSSAATSSPRRDQPDAEGARPRAVARIETEIVDPADEYAEASMGSAALKRFRRKS